jgi:hypothetical protein
VILTHTRTSTYNVVTFADPYKTCDECGEWIDGYLDSREMPNWPCGHKASYTDQCPSWGPVDGCSCVEILGEKPHGEPHASPSSQLGSSTEPNKERP